MLIQLDRETTLHLIRHLGTEAPYGLREKMSRSCKIGLVMEFRSHPDSLRFIARATALYGLEVSEALISVGELVQLHSGEWQCFFPSTVLGEGTKVDGAAHD